MSDLLFEVEVTKFGKVVLLLSEISHVYHKEDGTEIQMKNGNTISSKSAPYDLVKFKWEEYLRKPQEKQKIEVSCKTEPAHLITPLTQESPPKMMGKETHQHTPKTQESKS